ncbi:MAG: hypothetical protein Q9208_001384 [Pyrenodesmia sp. 3 TL-2023]
MSNILKSMASASLSRASSSAARAYSSSSTPPEPTHTGTPRRQNSSGMRYANLTTDTFGKFVNVENDVGRAEEAQKAEDKKDKDKPVVDGGKAVEEGSKGEGTKEEAAKTATEESGEGDGADHEEGGASNQAVS